MYPRAIPLLGLLAVLGGAAASFGDDVPSGDQKVAPTEHKSFYDFTVKNIDGSEVSLSDFKDRVCLVVNVASR